MANVKIVLVGEASPDAGAGGQDAQRRLDGAIVLHDIDEQALESTGCR